MSQERKPYTKYKRKPGERITKTPSPILTAEMIDAIVGFVKEGHPYSWICQRLGINRNTFNSWWYQGSLNKGDPKFRELYLRIAESWAEKSSALLGKIDKHPDWRAQAWVLERRDPENFGKPADRVEVTHVKEIPAEVEIVDVEAELVRRLGSGDN